MTGMHSDDGADRRPARTRRAVLKAGAVAGLAATAGCTGFSPPENSGTGPVSLDDFRGSAPIVQGRPALDGPSIADLPDLSGSLSIYIGGGEGGLYTALLDLFEQEYDDFSYQPRRAPSSQLATSIVDEVEGGIDGADLFWAVDAGSLGAVAEAGVSVDLPSDAISDVPENFRPDDRWVGVAGRARAVPYNTNQLSAEDVPDSVQEFPGTDALQGAMGWAPTYSAFQSFVTAMRVIRGEDTTRQWLEAMLDAGVSEYRDEWFTSNAVADGEIAAGFANHYYALRVMADREAAPIDLAFTSGDAGALINAAGVQMIEGVDDEELAVNLVRHLLTVEAQEFFATRSFSYPMIPSVPPVGDLPRIDELSPPDVDLQQLSDIEPTLDLMRDVGVL